MSKKEKINDAEVSSLEENDEEIITQKTESGKKYHLEIVLILIIGFLLGVMIKSEALKSISIGFNDYKVVSAKQGYNIDEIEKELMEKSKAAAEKAKEKEKQAQKKVEEEAKKAKEKATQQQNRDNNQNNNKETK